MWKDILDTYNITNPWIDGANYIERNYFTVATLSAFISAIMLATCSLVFFVEVVAWWPVYLALALSAITGYLGVSTWRQTRLAMEERMKNA